MRLVNHYVDLQYKATHSNSCTGFEWPFFSCPSVCNDFSSMNKRAHESCDDLVEEHPTRHIRYETPPTCDSGAPYPVNLLQTRVARFLYDLLTDLPTELINIITLYKEHEYANGVIYDGEWTADGDTRQGFGTLWEPNGDWQQGLFYRNELRTGRFRSTSWDGKVQQMIWREGLVHGMAKGHWTPDEPCSTVHVKYRNGSIYVGEMKNDKCHGHGKMTYLDGSMYDGEWRDGVQCGHGVLVYETGDQYTGEFNNNMFHGYGRFEGMASGAVDEGYFENDGIINGIHICKNGQVYDYVNGGYGPATLHLPNGEKAWVHHSFAKWQFFQRSMNKT